MNKTLAVCLLFVSFSLFASAQYPSSYVTGVDGSNWESTTCLNSPGCWWNITGTATSIGVDSTGDFWVANGNLPSNNIFHWNASTRAWTGITGWASDITVGNGKINVVGSGGQPYWWNGTGWQAFASSKTMLRLCTGIDGDIWGIDTSNAVWEWVNSVWTSRASGNGAIDIACEDASKVFIVGAGTNHQIGQWDGTGFPSVTNSPNGFGTVGTSGHGIYGTIAGTGVVYFNDMVGGGWKTVYGNKADIKGHAGFVMGVAPNGNIWHMNAMVFNELGTSSGSYTNFCNNHPNAPCAGATHTVKEQMTFHSGSGGVQGQAAGSPYSTLTAQSFAEANPGLCNPFFSDPNSSDCQPTEVWSGICSNGMSLSGGGLFTVNPPPCFIKPIPNAYVPVPGGIGVVAGFHSSDAVTVFIDETPNVGFSTTLGTSVCAAFTTGSAWQLAPTYTCSYVTSDPFPDSTHKYVYVTPQNVPTVISVGCGTRGGIPFGEGEVEPYKNDHLRTATVYCKLNDPFNGGNVTGPILEGILIHESGHLVFMGDADPTVYACVTVPPDPTSAQSMMVQDDPSVGRNCHFNGNTEPLVISACDVLWESVNYIAW